MKPKVYSSLLALFVFICVVFTSLYAQADSPDDLDQAIREISTYLNQHIPQAHKVAFLNVVSPSVQLSEYIIEELFANAINDKEFPVVSWITLNEARKQHNIRVNDDVPITIATRIGDAVNAQTIVTCRVSPLGDRYRIATTVMIAQTAQVYAQLNRNIGAGQTITALLRSSTFVSPTTTPSPTASANQPVPSVPQKPFTYKFKEDKTDPLYDSIVIFASGNMNWVGGKDTDDTGMLFDYGFGVENDVQRDSSQIIGGFGGRYSRRGYSLPDFTQTLTYLDILFKVKYDMYYDSTYSVHPYIGIITSILLNAESKWADIDYTYHRNEYFREGDTLGLLGVDITIQNLYVIGLEYNHGLLDITGQEPNEYYTFRAQNPSRARSLVLNLGIKFDLKPTYNRFW